MHMLKRRLRGARVSRSSPLATGLQDRLDVEYRRAVDRLELRDADPRFSADLENRYAMQANRVRPVR